MEHCLFNTPQTYNRTQVCDEMMLQCNHLHHLLSSMVLLQSLCYSKYTYIYIVNSSLFTHTKRCSLTLIQYTKSSTYEFSYWQLTYSEQEVFRTTNRCIHCSFCSRCTQKKYPHSLQLDVALLPYQQTLFITTVELKNEGFCDLTSHNNSIQRTHIIPTNAPYTYFRGVARRWVIMVGGWLLLYSDCGDTWHGWLEITRILWLHGGTCLFECFFTAKYILYSTGRVIKEK